MTPIIQPGDEVLLNDRNIQTKATVQSVFFQKASHTYQGRYTMISGTRSNPACYIHTHSGKRALVAASQLAPV